MKTVTRFSDEKYWEDQYQQCNKLYEWYQPWNLFKPHINHLLQPTCAHVLNLGSGNSPMSYDMLSDGIGLIDNIDISPTVTAQMQERYASEKRLQWFTMDARSLSFDDNTYDLVIEKGTIDALSCDGSASESVHLMLKESLRVMKPGGKFISISFGAPPVRLFHFQHPDLKWTVQEVIKVPKLFVADNFYYVYTAIKYRT